MDYENPLDVEFTIFGCHSEAIMASIKAFSQTCRSLSAPMIQSEKLYHVFVLYIINYYSWGFTYARKWTSRFLQKKRSGRKPTPKEDEFQGVVWCIMADLYIIKTCFIEISMGDWEMLPASISSSRTSSHSVSWFSSLSSLGNRWPPEQKKCYQKRFFWETFFFESLRLRDFTSLVQEKFSFFFFFRLFSAGMTCLFSDFNSFGASRFSAHHLTP